LKISIILRKKSHLTREYKKLKVSVYYLEIPTITSLTKLSSNFIYYIKFLIKFCSFNVKHFKFYKKLENYDYIHLNHENLFWILKFIKTKNKSKKVSISIRTILSRNFFSNLQINIINKYADRKLFISKKNLLEFNKQADVIKNNNFIIENFDLNVQPSQTFLKKKSYKKKLKILSLSNFSFERGVDRIVEIAQELYFQKNYDIEFNLLGDYKINSTKNIFKKKEMYNLKYLVEKKKLKNINVMGHKNHTKKYFNQNNLLIYLPRIDSAWGRNIIESLNNGLPVITLGETNTLIKNDKNGYFLKEYNKAEIIKIIKKIHKDREKLFNLSLTSKKLSLTRNNKKSISLKLANFFNF
jgi:glycosyltransferase involved in cell wall biosynthesis